MSATPCRSGSRQVGRGLGEGAADPCLMNSSQIRHGQKALVIQVKKIILPAETEDDFLEVRN